MKKILLLIDALGAGGAQRQIVGLAILLKNKGYEVMDHIHITYSGDDALVAAITAYADFVKQETLAESLTVGSSGDVFGLNGHDATIEITKVDG